MASAQLAENLLWVIHGFNIFGFFSQIYANHCLRSTAGFSFWTLWLCHCASQGILIYVYLLALPLPMRVMIPAELACMSVLVGQELWFAPTHEFRRQVTLWHGVVLCLASITWYIGFFFPQLVGYFAGWVCVVAVSFVQFPQIFRNWRRKSIEGFSIFFLVCTSISSCIFMWSCYMLNLPLPSWAHATRAVAKRIILWGQVVIYWGR